MTAPRESLIQALAAALPYVGDDVCREKAERVVEAMEECFALSSVRASVDRRMAMIARQVVLGREWELSRGAIEQELDVDYTKSAGASPDPAPPRVIIGEPYASMTEAFNEGVRAVKFVADPDVRALLDAISKTYRTEYEGGASLSSIPNGFVNEFLTDRAYGWAMFAMGVWCGAVMSAAVTALVFLQ